MRNNNTTYNKNKYNNTTNYYNNNTINFILYSMTNFLKTLQQIGNACAIALRQ